jgi:hypothetical protein
VDDGPRTGSRARLRGTNFLLLDEHGMIAVDYQFLDQ